MKTYIILLRGINVSGKNKILMQDLRNVLTSLGFQNVQTYIQSGNIILDSEEKKEYITTRIKEAIFTEFGFTVPLLIRTVKEWEKALANNPYIANDEKKVAFMFLDKKPKEKNISVNAPNDEYEIINDVVHIHCTKGFGHSKLTINIFEKKLNVTATTRNFRTTKKLLELAKNKSKLKHPF